MIYTSVSQLETLDLCARKLAFQSVLKLPRQKQASQEFGSVLHSVAERYLKNEPELYPEGWDVDEETKTKLSVTDAAMIQLLMRKAIDEGHIERCPDSEVERGFEIDFPSFAMPVRLVGYKDHESMFFARVEDHKTAKSDTYLFGPTKLRRSIQMMTYGYDLLLEAERRGLPKPPIVTLRHNQFVKNPEFPYVTHAQAEVTSAEIEEFMRVRVLPLIEQRVKLQSVKNPLKEIPDPKPSACNAYGGCQFRHVCGGYETPLQYSARINRLNNPSLATQSLTMTAPTSPSDFLARRAAINPPPAAPAAPAATQVVGVDLAKGPDRAVSMAAAPSIPAQGSGVTPPPWAACEPANRTCPACRGTGWKANKQPCRICIATTKVSPDAFEWEVSADGTTVSWWKKGERAAAPAATTAAPAVATKPATQKSYSVGDFIARVAAAQTSEAVSAVLHEATTMLAAADVASLTLAAEARLDALEARQEVQEAMAPAEPPAPTPPPAPVEPPAPTPPPAPEEPPAPTPPPAPEEPKKERKPRAPKAAAAPQEAPAPTNGPNIILLIGCAKPASWPGYSIVTAEEILSRVPGYWDTVNERGIWDAAAAFRRRDAVRASIAAGKLPDGLTNVVVVQQFRDPDCNNLMSALATVAELIITGVPS